MTLLEVDCYPLSAELCQCPARAYNRGSSPPPIPDFKLPGIGGPSPWIPIPDLPGSHESDSESLSDHWHPPGRPHPSHQLAEDRGSSPSPVPIGGSAPWPKAERCAAPHLPKAPRPGPGPGPGPGVLQCQWQVYLHWQPPGRGRPRRMGLAASAQRSVE
jgi:hypothetical protein